MEGLETFLVIILVTLTVLLSIIGVQIILTIHEIRRLIVNVRKTVSKEAGSISKDTLNTLFDRLQNKKS